MNLSGVNQSTLDMMLQHALNSNDPLVVIEGEYARNPNYHLPNAFNLFIDERRLELENKSEQIDSKEFYLQCTAQWLDLSELEKSRYREAAKKAQDDFKMIHQDYIEPRAKVLNAHSVAHPVRVRVILDANPIDNVIAGITGKAE